MSESYRKVYTDNKYVNNFSASNIKATDTLIADNIISNNIVGPFGPVGGIVSYSIATDTNTDLGFEEYFFDINNISNPGGVILASIFTDGSIFEAYYSGKLNANITGESVTILFGLTFNPVNPIIPILPNLFGVTAVTNADVTTDDDQSFEYRCTFRVVSHTDTTINITFNTSAQIVKSNDDPLLQSSFALNQSSDDNIQKLTKDRTLDGNINLAFCAFNLTDATPLNFSRYTSYIKRIV